jgi:hypothetical protein
VYPTQVAEWAGRSADVLPRIYAKCIAGQDELAKRRISEALRQELFDISSSLAQRVAAPRRDLILTAFDDLGFWHVFGTATRTNWPPAVHSRTSTRRPTSRRSGISAG